MSIVESIDKKNSYGRALWPWMMAALGGGALGTKLFAIDPRQKGLEVDAEMWAAEKAPIIFQHMFGSAGYNAAGIRSIENYLVHGDSYFPLFSHNVNQALVDLGYAENVPTAGNEHVAAKLMDQVDSLESLEMFMIGGFVAAMVITTFVNIKRHNTGVVSEDVIKELESKIV